MSFPTIRMIPVRRMIATDPAEVAYALKLLSEAIELLCGLQSPVNVDDVASANQCMRDGLAAEQRLGEIATALFVGLTGVRPMNRATNVRKAKVTS